MNKSASERAGERGETRAKDKSDVTRPEPSPQGTLASGPDVGRQNSCSAGPNDIGVIRAPVEITEIQTVEADEFTVSTDPDRGPSFMTPAYMGEPEEPRPQDLALPDAYGEGRIVAMVRDPYWIHVFWEVSEDAVAEVVDRVRGARNVQRVIRVHDVTRDEPEGKDSDWYRDIAINGRARNWYIEVNQPNHKYRVEFGLLVDGSEFIPLLVSNTVATPRADVSDVIDEKWMVIEEAALYSWPWAPSSASEFMAGE